MPKTIGYHFVKTTYGTWLPGDARGHWSSAWSMKEGYIEHRQRHEGQSEREVLAVDSMRHAAVTLTPEVQLIIENEIAACQKESPWKIAAAAIEPTHLHLLITYSGRPIEQTARWLAARMTQAIHRGTTHLGPVWTEGYWGESIADESHWRNLVGYIERHNIERGLGPRPFSFLT